MKRLSRILPFLLVATLATVPFAFGQSADGIVSGKVVDRDGQTAVQGATLWIDSLVTNNGRLQVRERLEAKTNKDGRYSKSGLYVGRVRITLVVDGQPLMVKGEAIGDELFLASGIDTVANFDMSKAPAVAPAVATAAASPTNEADREALRKKLEEEAANSDAMTKAFEAGKVAYTARNYTEAITLFKSAADKIPVPPPAGVADIIWANLGKAYDANKQYDEAIEAYTKAIAFKPTESNYYVNLSLAQISAGKLDDSQTSIAKAAELNPANAGMAYYNLAATLINRNQMKEAAAHLKKAIEVDPTYGNAYYQMGMISVQENKLSEAVTFLEKYVQITPNPPAGDPTMGPCAAPVAQCIQTAKDLITFAKSSSGGK